MKLSTGIGLLSANNVEKNLSKKILLANSPDKKNVGDLGFGQPSDPIFFKNSGQSNFTHDVRYRNNFGYNPLTGIDGRNALLLFSENNEIKKALKAITNEIIVGDLKTNKYPVYPTINLTNIPEEKQKVAKSIQEYLDKVFYPKLYKWLNLKGKGLGKLIREYLITGKLAFEIVYDNPKKPKEIINIVPLDPSELQMFKHNGFVYYVQQPVSGTAKERILHENQIILIEWNEYDYGFVSYVDQLKRPFNIMRSMQTAKIMWFAVKSQVRMHIKLNMGDVPRNEAIQKLASTKSQYQNNFEFEDSDGTIKFNGSPAVQGYQEFFTAETSNSGTPEIEEVIGNGPDLTEVDSLQYWEKLFWKDTEIPFDRIDPNSSETWNFTDVNNLKKIEINFSKFTDSIRDDIVLAILKPITIQLTLKEVEIGVDLGLIDSIKAEWVAFNQYDKLGELEVLDKKISIATNLANFGEVEDVNGRARKVMPINWIVKNYLDFTPEQLVSMEEERKRENISLGFDPEITEKETEEEEEEIEKIEEIELESEEDVFKNIIDSDDDNF